jgi:WD40 repeat protein
MVGRLGSRIEEHEAEFMNSPQAFRKTLLCLLMVGWCVLRSLPAQGQPPSSRTDALGDPLPEGAVLRLGTARLRHPGRIDVLLFTDDGKSLIALGWKGLPSAWDVESGKRIETDATQFELLDKATEKSVLARIHPALWSTMAFGREGNTLIAVDPHDHVVTAWDIESGKETSKQDKDFDGTLPNTEKRTTSALVRFLDPLTNEEKQTTIRLSYIWQDWSLADDGKHLRVHYWGAGEPRKVETREKSAGATKDLPEKKLAVIHRLVISGWDKVSAQDLERKEFIRSIVPLYAGGAGVQTCTLSCLALSPDGKVLAGGTDNGHLELRDMTTGERVGGSRFHPGFFSGPFQFVAGGKSALVTLGDETVVWNLAEGKKVRGFGEDSAGGEYIVSPDGQSFLDGEWTGTAYKNVSLWEISSGKKLWTLDVQLRSLGAQFSTEGQTVAIFDRYQTQGVTFVSAKSGEKIRTFPADDLEPELSGHRVMKISPEMMVATKTTSRQGIQLWDPTTGKKRWTWTMPDDCREHLRAVHFVPGGKYALAEIDGLIAIKECLFLLDAKTGKQLAAIPGWDLKDISQDGRFIAYISKEDDHCVVRNLQTEETVLTLAIGSEGRFSADSKVFACAQGFCGFCSGNTPSSIEFHDLQSKQRLGPPRARPTKIRDMIFAPRGSILAVTYNDSTVILWDARAGSR